MITARGKTREIRFLGKTREFVEWKEVVEKLLRRHWTNKILSHL
jgi:hypothetical protein